MVIFVANGKHKGKSAYLVRKRFAGLLITIGTICFDAPDWILRSGTGRVDRFERLRDAKNEALKL